MEMASSSAPATSYYNVSVAHAVLTLSVNAVLIGLTALVKSFSSSSSSSTTTTSSSTARRREAAPAPAPASPTKPAAASARAIDMDVVLGLMGGAGRESVSVGFDEAAALFDEEEATVEEARAAFAVFDRDGDGFIGAAELGTVLRSLGLMGAGVAAAECQRMIDAYDEDRDGRIDFREFVNLMETTH